MATIFQLLFLGCKGGCLHFIQEFRLGSIVSMLSRIDAFAVMGSYVLMGSKLCSNEVEVMFLWG